MKGKAAKARLVGSMLPQKLLSRFRKWKSGVADIPARDTPVKVQNKSAAGRPVG